MHQLEIGDKLVYDESVYEVIRVTEQRVVARRGGAEITLYRTGETRGINADVYWQEFGGRKKTAYRWSAEWEEARRIYELRQSLRYADHRLRAFCARATPEQLEALEALFKATEEAAT